MENFRAWSSLLLNTKQRFYDADLLLDPAQQRSANATPAPVVPATRSQTDLEAGHGKEYTPTPPAPVHATPWYKTRKGIIGLIILAIVIIAAVVGGAVGGTVGKNNNNKSSDSNGQAPIAGPSSSATSTVSSGGAGISSGGGAPIGSSTSTTEESSTAENQPIATGTSSSGGGVAPIGTALAIANVANDSWDFYGASYLHSSFIAAS